MLGTPIKKSGENSLNNSAKSDYVLGGGDTPLGEITSNNMAGTPKSSKSIESVVNLDAEYICKLQGQEVRILKCKTCKILRPPRSFHCSDCGACIEVHDHHCPWVGTCVGKRNHRFFFLFALMTALHATYTAILNLVFLTKEMYGEEDTDKWNTPHTISIALVIFTCLITCCVGCLSGYHGKLVVTGITTNEEIRGKVSEQNPYDLGCFGNCWAFWYGGTSRVYIEGTYDAESLS